MNCPPPNPFLYSLFHKASTYLSQCDPASTIILAPVASSISAIEAETGVAYGDNLSEDFVQSHVLSSTLLKDEVPERSRARVYATINGKTMVIKEDVVFPHRGFRGVREVRILHDTLFWLDDPNSSPYLVYFLDRPLIGTPLHLESTSHKTSMRPKITTWAGLIERYKSIEPTMEPHLKRLFDEFDEVVQNERPFDDRPDEIRVRPRAPSINSISPVLDRVGTATSYSTSTTLQFVRGRLDIVLAGAIRAFQALPQTLLHSIGVESCLTGPEIEKLIEAYCLDHLYDLLFFKLTIVTKEKDEEVALAIQRSRWVDVTQLGTCSSLDLRRRLSRATDSFKGFGELHLPNAKLEALLSTISILMRNSEKSSDDLIPSLVSVVLGAGVSTLGANLLWIREFSFSDVDGGESGFALSTLEAVMYHITSSVDSLSIISARNQAFFDSLSSDEDVVQDIVDTYPELLEIRDPDSRTPHYLSSPKALKILLDKPTSPSNLSQLLLSTLSLDVLNRILELDPPDVRMLLNETDASGQSFAHKVFELPEALAKVSNVVDWTLKDVQGNTPLLVLSRIYDHPEYEELLETVFATITSKKRKIRLADHVDAKGNTLAHVTPTERSIETIFKHCVGDFNMLNDKGLSPLLVSIKFARPSILEYLLSRSEVDPLTRDFRGHSAIHYAARSTLTIFNTCIRAGLNIDERTTGSSITPLHIASRDGNIPILKRLIALDAEEAWDWRGFKPGDIVKNDIVRSIMDEWACRYREVRVLRGHVGEDCSVRFLIKSKSGGGVLRSVPEFVKLRHWMLTRYSALGIASLHLTIPAPCLLHSRPSRSVLLALTERLDAFIESLLKHDEIKQTPVLWEFLLSPTTDEHSIQQTIQAEVESQRASIWRDAKALSNYESTQVFFHHAREQIVQLSSTYRVFERKTRINKDAQLNVSVAYGMTGKALSRLTGLDPCYARALDDFSEALVPKEPSLFYRLIEDVVSLDCRISGLLHSLMIPDQIIERIEECTEEIERHERELSKTPKFHLSLMADSQARKKANIKLDLQSLHLELKHSGSELRHNETVLADEMSRFYSAHEENARSILQRFTSQQVKVEREKLKSMERAMSTIRGRRSNSSSSSSRAVTNNEDENNDEDDEDDDEGDDD